MGMGTLIETRWKETGMTKTRRPGGSRKMAEVERMAQGTVWLEGGCRSWYVDRRNGRLTTLWPESAYSFRRVNGRFDPARYRQRAGQPVPG